MKALFSALLVLLVAVGIAMAVRDDPGYVMISIRDWTLESSLVVFLIAAVIAFVVAYYLLRFLSASRHLPRNYSRWQRLRHERESMRGLALGYAALASCRWRDAEMTLVKSANNNHAPFLNYLFAARAALKQGENARCAGYLNKAKQAMKKGDVAVGIAEVASYMAQGKYDLASELLHWLRCRAPKDKGVTGLGKQLYIEMAEWGKLLKLIPQLRALGLVTLAEKSRLEDLAYRGLFNKAVAEKEGHALMAAWKRAPKSVRRSAGMAEDYVKQLMKLGYGDAAESVIYDAIKYAWDEKLLYLYGLLESADSIRQLHRAEIWLKGHPHNPVLLLTLGRLCIRNEQWKRARQYLEESFALHPNAETCRELGGLLERQGEERAALDYYRQGMMLTGHEGSGTKEKLPLLLSEPVPVNAALPSSSTRELLAAP